VIGFLIEFRLVGHLVTSVHWQLQMVQNTGPFSSNITAIRNFRSTVIKERILKTDLILHVGYYFNLTSLFLLLGNLACPDLALFTMQSFRHVVGLLGCEVTTCLSQGLFC
jgi:hypothetical protein